MAALATPCTGICKLEPASGLCIGCARTLDEIGRWSTFTSGERAAVMAALPSRRPPVNPAG